MVGRVFGRLTVVSRHSSGPTRWTCKCECGAVTHPRQESLRSGHTTSCGCSRGLTTHGMTGHELYRTWARMKSRCLCPTDGDFHRYGARGISVCARWVESFASFVTDMGPRPSTRHSLDRIDNSGNYEPSNCRWATATEQSRNRRSTRLISYAGKTLSVTEWEEQMGLPIRTISNRINKHGWGHERAIVTPLRKNA